MPTDSPSAAAAQPATEHMAKADHDAGPHAPWCADRSHKGRWCGPRPDGDESSAEGVRGPR